MNWWEDVILLALFTISLVNVAELKKLRDKVEYDNEWLQMRINNLQRELKE